MEIARLLSSQVREAYVQHVAGCNLQPETVQCHSACLDIFLGYLEAQPESRSEPLSEARVQDFLIDYAGVHGVRCREHIHGMLRCFLPFAHQRGIIDRDLTAAVPSLRVYRHSNCPAAISEQHAEAVLNMIDPGPAAGACDYAMLPAVRIYDVRAVQIRRLCLDHIDWDNDLVRFPAAKRGSPVTVPLLPEIGNRLMEYILHFRDNDTDHRQVFLCGSPARPLGASVISSRVRCYINRADVELQPGARADTHAFRYACAASCFHGPGREAGHAPRGLLRRREPTPGAERAQRPRRRDAARTARHVQQCLCAIHGMVR